MSLSRELAELAPLSIAAAVAFVIGTNAVASSGFEVDLTQPAEVTGRHIEHDRSIYTDGKNGVEKISIPPAYRLTLERCQPDGNSASGQACPTETIEVKKAFYNTVEPGDDIIAEPTPQRYIP